MRSSFIALGLSLGLVANLVAQTEAETQRATLTGLRSFAVYARVQLSQSATLQRIDERVLRNKIEDALRREGIRVQTRNDMRDGSQASLDLLYMVIQTKDTSGHALGFAASSCLQASQMVRIPRLTTPKHIAYAVVSTWRSCGLLVGDSASLGPTILQNADEHIIRFIDAWRFANTPPPDPRFPATSELSMAGGQYRRWRQLFEVAQRLDLEGIVAKRDRCLLATDGLVQGQEPCYTQAEGRGGIEDEDHSGHE
jgi:hypothetical protein